MEIPERRFVLAEGDVFLGRGMESDLHALTEREILFVDHTQQQIHIIGPMPLGAFR